MSPFIRLIILNFLLSCPLVLHAEEPAAPPDPPTASSQPPVRQEEKGLVFSLSGEFDKYFFPSKLDFALPIFKLNIQDIHIDFNDLAFNFHKDLTKNGLELANISARAKKVFIQVPKEDITFNLENFEKATENQEDGDVINSTLRSKFDRLTLPKQLLETAEDLNLRYSSALEFHRLDAKSLLELQKHFYKLRDDGMFDQFFEASAEGKEDAAGAVGGLFAMAMLGKFAELAPKMIARSPEMVLNNFSLTSEKSELNIIGQANVAVIGNPNESEQKAVTDPNVVGTAKFDVRIEKNLFNHLLTTLDNVEKNQAKVKALVDEKLINDTGSHYEVTLTADYKENKLTMSQATETLLQMFDSPKPVDGGMDAANEAINLMRDLSTEVAQQYEKTGKWTVTQKLSGETSGQYTAKIESNTKQLYLQATLKGINDGLPASVARKTIRLSYDRKEKTWKCAPGKPNGIGSKNLPADCQ